MVTLQSRNARKINIPKQNKAKKDPIFTVSNIAKQKNTQIPIPLVIAKVRKKGTKNARASKHIKNMLKNIKIFKLYIY